MNSGVTPTPAVLTVRLAAGGHSPELQRHGGRLGQNRAEARLDRSQFARVSGAPGRPHHTAPVASASGVSRPLVEAPALGVAVGEDRINITGLVRRVRECGKADVERRLNPFATLLCHDGMSGPGHTQVSI